ncbi:MAG TPA: ATP-binding cassette domain-containing protein, partial [Polyangiaceae bacterium]
MSSTGALGDIRLEVRGVQKSFAGTAALSGVELVARRGEVHAILGENGAGKSTLMKILSGALAADAGTILLDGTPFSPRSPIEARQRGVSIVYQEPELCAELTVAESVLLGGEPARYGVIDRLTQRERALASLKRVVPDDQAQRLAPDSLIKTLSPSERQLVALARALAHGDCRVLILDEPTSALSAADVARLFDVVADLAASGITVLYISHFLEEVERVATRFTMLRDGRSVASGDLATTTRSELVTLMAGRAVSELFPR